MAKLNLYNVYEIDSLICQMDRKTIYLREIRMHANKLHVSYFFYPR